MLHNLITLKTFYKDGFIIGKDDMNPELESFAKSEESFIKIKEKNFYKTEDGIFVGQDIETNYDDKDLRDSVNAILHFSKEIIELTDDSEIEQLSSENLLHAKNIKNKMELKNEWSKLKEDQLLLSDDSISLKEIIETIKENYNFLAKKENISLDIEYKDMERDSYITDRSALSLIINQIVNFSMQRTSQGKVSIHVKGFNYNIMSEVEIVIKDTSEGFNKKDQLILFNNQKDGINLAKKMVEIIGGSFEFVSIFGKGNEFKISIPMTKGSILYKNCDKYNAKALIVDDLGINQSIAERILKRKGIDCDFASNGLEAINLVNSHSYDLIFMDCLMPVMDGFTATLKIRESGFNGPIIGITGYVGQEARNNCIEVGMTKVIYKPFDLTQFENLLGEFLNTKAINAKDTIMDRNEVFSTSDLSYFLSDDTQDYEDNIEFVKTLISTFKSKAPTYIEAIEKGLETKNKELIKRNIHTFKSSVGAVGLIEASNLATKLDKTIFSIELDVAEKLFKDFLKSYYNGREKLDEFEKSLYDKKSA